jgi:hypothetical protein
VTTNSRVDSNDTTSLHHIGQYVTAYASDLDPAMFGAYLVMHYQYMSWDEPTLLETVSDETGTYRVRPNPDIRIGSAGPDDCIILGWLDSDLVLNEIDRWSTDKVLRMGPDAFAREVLRAKRPARVDDVSHSSVVNSAHDADVLQLDGWYGDAIRNDCMIDPDGDGYGLMAKIDVDHWRCGPDRLVRVQIRKDADREAAAKLLHEAAEWLADPTRAPWDLFDPIDRPSLLICGSIQ